MKEKENTSAKPNKKKILTTVIIAVCALLLITATVLTVYFVTSSSNEIAENPPAGNPPSDNPPDDGKTDDDKPDDQKPDDKPSGGEGKVLFVSPVETKEHSVEYHAVYNNQSLDRWYYHDAVDFSAAAGTEVCAMADGTVLEVSMEEVLGNCIVIEHEGGIKTTYRFVEPVSSLKAGDKVKQGQKIGTVAEAYGTEYKDGAHLHLEMELDGKPVDPTDYIDVTLEEK